MRSRQLSPHKELSHLMHTQHSARVSQFVRNTLRACRRAAGAAPTGGLLLASLHANAQVAPADTLSVPDRAHLAGDHRHRAAAHGDNV
jgi:hypothetical protein